MYKQTPKIIRTIAAILIGLMCVSELSGCMMNSPKATALEDINLSDVVFAIGSNPQSAGGDVTRYKHGLVIFIMKDGSTKYVKTSGMFAQNLMWTQKGLFFIDRDNDYHLWMEDGKTHSSKTSYATREPYEDALIADPNGNPVSFISLGMNTNSDGTYQLNKIQIHHLLSPQRDMKVTVDSPETSAYCGTNLYGITYGFSRLNNENDSKILNAINPLFFYNFSDNSSFFKDLPDFFPHSSTTHTANTTITKQEDADYSIIGNSSSSLSTCSNDTFPFFVQATSLDYNAGDLAQFYRGSWNVHTKSITMNPISTSSGNPFKATLAMSSHALGDGAFLLTTEDGEFYRVDKKNIATKLESYKADSSGGLASTTTKHYIISIFVNPDTNAVITVRDIKTGKILSTFECDKQLTSQINGQNRLNMTSIAANPELVYDTNMEKR